MKPAFLRDEVEGKRHDLAMLVLNHGAELHVGRDPKNNVIVLASSLPKRETRVVVGGEIKDEGIDPATVSRMHALISYMPGEVRRDNGDYILTNMSGNGTIIRRGEVSHYLKKDELKTLKHGDQIWFGPRYGPVTYEEIGSD